MTISHEAMRQLMADATKRLADGGVEVGAAVSSMPDVVDVRRRRLSGLERIADAGYLTLVRGDDGLLDWQVDAGPSPWPTRRAARRGLFDAQPIDQVAFKPVQGSQVASFLATLDRGFNARYGLFDLNGRRVDTVARDGRVLLLVHGAFSRCDSIVQQLRSLPDGSGEQWLAAARAAYSQVLLFEHPTLAVGPMLNALDLARAFAGSAAQVDVVCHSRGGLVVRWWLEVLSRQLLSHARVVFVGSPLMGTGLASPHRLRAALKMLTNFVAVIQQASSLASLAVPMFAVIEGLMALVASSTSLLSKAPVADAAVAMVPGLAAMSRFGPDGSEFISGNFELEKLAFGWTQAPSRYFSVSSNFETQDPAWRFWQSFRQLKERAADAATDILFAGENDLVVDTDSMSRIGVGARIADASHRLEFGTNSVVHHLNYFGQPKTVAFIRNALGV
jgi:hypothetical protein